MSGHSKWSSIKHKKGALDAKRGKLFTKLIREITVAAREGGGDADSNPRLRLAVQKAKDANMPADNIERGIKKGTGELEGVSYESISFEGYAVGGVAVIVDVLTDNRNRATSSVRAAFAKRGGNMAGAGSVSFQFDRKGIFIIKKSDMLEEEIFELIIDAGAEDMELQDDGSHEVICAVQDFDRVRKALTEKGIEIDSGELGMVPKNIVKVDDSDTAQKVLALIDDLEDNDDVQNVYSNFDIPDDIMKVLEEQ